MRNLGPIWSVVPHDKKKDVFSEEHAFSKYIPFCFEYLIGFGDGLLQIRIYISTANSTTDRSDWTLITVRNYTPSM
jgi:hypothetical protein